MAKFYSSLGTDRGASLNVHVFQDCNYFPCCFASVDHCMFSSWADLGQYCMNVLLVSFCTFCITSCPFLSSHLRLVGYCDQPYPSLPIVSRCRERLRIVCSPRQGQLNVCLACRDAWHVAKTKVELQPRPRM